MPESSALKLLSSLFLLLFFEMCEGKLMHHELSKDEIIVSVLLFTFAIFYRISEDHQANVISHELALLIFMICTAFLCFNRIVKLLINRVTNRNNFYCTSAFIQYTKFIPSGKGSYICYIIRYQDESHNIHEKELHSFFSIRNIKIGDEIKINVDRNNPDNIIVVLSDFMIAIIMCVIGIIFESILIAVYMYAH